MNEIQVTYAVTEDEYTRSMKVYQRRAGSRAWKYASAALFALGMVYVFLLHLLGVGAFLAFLGLLIPLRVAYYYRVSLPRAFRADPAPEVTLWFSPSGVRVHDEHSDSTSNWSAFCGFWEQDGLFLLRVSKRLCVTVPARAFASAEEVDQFRQLLQDQIKPLKGAAPARPTLMGQEAARALEAGKDAADASAPLER